SILSGGDPLQRFGECRDILPAERFQLHVAMLALQFGYAGFHVVSRAALNMGVSKLVFPVYRNIIAFLLLVPFAYFLEKKERPAITLNFLLQFFLLALVGCGCGCVY
ncbi:auxin-induced 5NG4-like protein, partial [Trifolium medium]|nr:auxin-induced 5NG4-like protein [Trifolium medium]